MSALDGLGIEVCDANKIIDSILDGVIRLLPTFSSIDILSCVSAFDHFGYYWKDFPEKFQTSFLDYVKAYLTEMEAGDRGMLMLRLSRLALPRESFESLECKQ